MTNLESMDNVVTDTDIVNGMRFIFLELFSTWGVYFD